MAAITSAVVGTAITIKGQRDAKKAQQSALNQQRNAAIESANVLAKAGRGAEADLLRQANLAGATSSQGAQDAMATLAPFVDYQAMQRSQDEILGNLGLSGPIADSIRQASTEYVKSRPEFQGGNVMEGQVQRQGDLAVGQAGADFRDRMLTAGQQGLAAAGDVARIEQAGIQRLSDIAGGTASQRASVLTGSAPVLSQLSSSAEESRMLSGIVGQNSQANQFESLAGLAGKLYDPKAGLVTQRNIDNQTPAPQRTSVAMPRATTDTQGSF